MFHRHHYDYLLKNLSAPYLEIPSRNSLLNHMHLSHINVFIITAYLTRPLVYEIISRIIPFKPLSTQCPRSQLSKWRHE